MRGFIFAILAVLAISGCSQKEFNSGVDDIADGVSRVINGTNN